jgi:hypothetical protein
LQQFVFFDRSGQFIASGGILGGWFFRNSAHIFSVLMNGFAGSSSSKT